MSTFTAPLNMRDPDRTAVGYVTATQWNTLTFNNAGVAKVVFTIPKPYSIESFFVDVLTAFNSSGTDLVSAGIQGGSATAFFSGMDVSTIGRKLGSANVTAPQLTAWQSATDATGTETITMTFTQSVADATTGNARVGIVYACPQQLSD